MPTSKAIKDTEAAWSKTSAAKDAEKFASYYTDDASLLPQDGGAGLHPAGRFSTWFSTGLLCG
jgi:ketosteroid isomerase-like protein